MPRYRTISCAHCGFMQLKRDLACEQCGRVTARERKRLIAGAVYAAVMVVIVLTFMSRVKGVLP